MLLKANKYRKDKKADCRQNELGSRIFMGRIFGDYAECLHFYPSFSYGRIIAGSKQGDGKACGVSPNRVHQRNAGKGVYHSCAANESDPF